MAQVKGRTAYATNRGRERHSEYVYGNVAVQPDVRRQLEEAPKKKLSHEIRKNRDRAQHMSLGYVLFLTSALVASGMFLVNYIQMQSALTNKVKQISTLESKLNTLKVSNDEEYNRIMSNVDLEEIRRIAIVELGMVYAKEGQVYTYKNEGNDYMRKVVAD